MKIFTLTASPPRPQAPPSPFSPPCAQLANRYGDAIAAATMHPFDSTHYSYVATHSSNDGYSDHGYSDDGGGGGGGEGSTAASAPPGTDSRAIRVDELGDDDDAIKAKVGRGCRMGRVTLAL